jgi:hypothetical protein
MKIDEISHSPSFPSTRMETDSPGQNTIEVGFWHGTHFVFMSRRDPALFFSLVHISPIVDLVHKKPIIFSIDAEDDPYPSCPHPQKTLPFTFQPFDIQLLKGNKSLRFNAADKGFELDSDSLFIFFIKLFQELDCSAMEMDPHSFTQSVISVKSSPP